MLTIPPTPLSTAHTPAQQATPPVESAGTAQPDLGAQAVTAARSSHATANRLSAGRSSEVDPLAAPADPPPIKGLGIPPLDMTQVGDFDRPDDDTNTPVSGVPAAQSGRALDLRR